MARRYLEELGIEIKNTPWGWEDSDKARNKIWKEEREEDGFDERETWSLDFTMNLLLYERLCKYKEIASKVVNLKFHIFTFNGEELTELECIDRMIEGLKYDLTLDPYDDKRKNDEHIKERIENVWKLYDLCKYSLWW